MTKLVFYWQKNRERWTIDDKLVYSLTDKAPQEAIDSYNHYQEQIKEKSKDHHSHII